MCTYATATASGLSLDPSSQPVHSRWPIGHTPGDDFTKSGAHQVMKVRLGTVQQFGRNPARLLFAEFLTDPLFKQPSVLRFLQKAQPVPHHFAGSSVAPQRDQLFYEGVLMGW